MIEFPIRRKNANFRQHNAKGNQGENERSQSYFAGILDQIDKRFSDFRSEMNTRFDKIDADAKWRFRITLTILGLALAILKWL